MGERMTIEKSSQSWPTRVTDSDWLRECKRMYPLKGFPLNAFREHYAAGRSVAEALEIEIAKRAPLLR